MKPMFKTWAEMEEVPILQDGHPVYKTNGDQAMEFRQKPRWSTDFTLDWLMKSGRAMALEAARTGWHMRLIDYVQHRHRLPKQHEIDQLCLEQQTIDQFQMPQTIEAKREQYRQRMLGN